MRTPELLILFAWLLSISPAHARKATSPSRVPRNAVLLSNVASLTLRANKLTSSRRVKAIPQLDCVGPDHVCALYKVDVMRCKNEGADYDAENIQWSCKASLPDDFKLGSTEVLCEGYENSDDPYILKGSCGVEYRLLLTEKGMRKYGNGEKQHYEHDSLRSPPPGQSSNLGGVVFAIIFAIVLFVILRGIFRAWRAASPRTGPQRRGGNHRTFGGSGGGDDNDPPPPYDYPPSYPRSPPQKRNQQSSSSSGGGSSRTASSQARTQQTTGQWQPGFWTGAFTGAAAGYAASRLTNRPQTQTQTQTQTSRRPVFDSPSARSSSTGSGSAPSSSSERYESTGFGGTRRR